ncbi:cytochrome c oxidase polypeptide IV [Flagelloscypha sp. PMI_526]|nr:cytochrome c oxidase polypeptide IV [Flagelloscypha sp. PMI_526]
MTLLRVAFKAAARPAMRRMPVAARAISSTPLRKSDHGPPPTPIFGPGAKDGTVPTDFEQATGLERLQMLGELEGFDIFDMSPLDSSRTGTLKDPILVPSWADDRILGCTGSPADSHDTLWFHLYKDGVSRCEECGSVYKMDYLMEGEEPAHAHH